MRIERESRLGVFEDLNRKFPTHRGKVLKEDPQRVARLQVLEKDAHGYSRADEDRRSTEDLGV
jgi:hypothetical protein